MQNELIKLPNAEIKVCDSCGKKNVRMSFETQKFKYGAEDTVELSARVPVWSCQTCGEQYTDHCAEKQRHAAVCKYLGRLTPEEIVALRDLWNMTQAEWAEVTGLGLASIKRWETGNLIQGAAFDKFMRLLTDRRNIESLRSTAAPTHERAVKHLKFRTRLSSDATLHASAFKLRGASSA
jgi:putative zinc finger/helix-turn-helix YgiT family protein